MEQTEHLKTELRINRNLLVEVVELAVELVIVDLPIQGPGSFPESTVGCWSNICLALPATKT